MSFLIKKFRKELGWTQEKLAREADVSRTIIAGLESGAIKVTKSTTLLKLSKALNKPVSDLFFEEKV